MYEIADSCVYLYLVPVDPKLLRHLDALRARTEDTRKPSWHNSAYFIMKVHRKNTRDTQRDGHAVAFFPRAFFGGRAFFSFCAAIRAEVRPRAACP